MFLTCRSALNGTVQEQNDYYPYGGRHTSGNTYAALPGNNHKFNGKEEQTTANIGYLDYGARMYDNVTGRWGTPDPLAEKYKSMSPYNYCLNNPVMFVDPDGKKPDDYFYDRSGKLIDFVKTNQLNRFFLQDNKGTIRHSNQQFDEIELNSELGYLSRIIYAEAGGENQISKEAVGDVMRNRVESSKYPTTYQSVAEQKVTTKKGFDIYQFTSVNPKDASNWRYANPNTAKNQGERNAFVNSVAAAIKVFNDGSGITQGALLYYSPKSMVPKMSEPKWNFNLLKEITIPGVASDSFKFYKYK